MTNRKTVTDERSAYTDVRGRPTFHTIDPSILYVIGFDGAHVPIGLPSGKVTYVEPMWWPLNSKAAAFRKKIRREAMRKLQERMRLDGYPMESVDCEIVLRGQKSANTGPGSEFVPNLLGPHAGCYLCADVQAIPKGQLVGRKNV